MPQAELTRELNKSIRDVRMRFLDLCEPYRDDLFRYALSLTGSVWDAEDLVQETLLRAFSKLGEAHWDVRSTKAYLFRMATNGWIDRKRRDEPRALDPAFDAAAPEPGAAPGELREAIATLARALPPQEGAALLLKDVFGFSLEETADLLSTTSGAVKAALHRGRGRLAAGHAAATPPPPRRDVSEAQLDRFVELFNARELKALSALFLEDAQASVYGMVHEYGREQIEKGSLYHTMFGEEGQPRAERRMYRGTPVVVIWYETTRDGVAVREVGDVLVFRGDDAGLVSLVYYYFCPEVLTAVAKELGLPVQTNGHRYKPGT